MPIPARRTSASLGQDDRRIGSAYDNTLKAFSRQRSAVSQERKILPVPLRYCVLAQVVHLSKVGGVMRVLGILMSVWGMVLVLHGLESLKWIPPGALGPFSQY